jgi:IS30 family transposase
MACHLTFAERGILYRLLKEGHSKTDIARLMGRDRSTIHRELNRNAGARGYRPMQAQRLAEVRRESCRKPSKLDDPVVKQFVEKKLERRWSPDQIAGRARRDFRRNPHRHLSRQTISNWIHKHAGNWRPFLRRGGRLPEKRGKLIACVRIDGRPDVINRRRRYRDWEVDV